MESKTIQLIPIDRLECDPQVRERFDEESLVGLAESIKASGVLQPLLVRRDGDRLVILEGERRVRACRKAGETHVPVQIDDRELDDVEVTLRQLVLNTQRENLSAVERGRTFARLMEKSGWTAAETARRTGLSEATISRDTAILTLPPDILRRVESGEIKASTAYQIAIAGNSEEQSKLAEATANGRLPRDRVVELTRRSRRASQPRRVSRPKRERFTVRLGPGRSLTVSGPNLTLTSLTEWLQALLKRIGTMEPQNMALADAAKALSADASCKGVVS